MIIDKELHGFRQIVDTDWLDQADPTKTIPVTRCQRFDPEGQTVGVELRMASEEEQDVGNEAICYVFTDADPGETCECPYCTEQMKVFCL